MRTHVKIHSNLKKYLVVKGLSKGYWQIPVAEQDVPKTAFVTMDRHYEFLRMPFGMVNSGATLVRGLRKVLADMPNVHSYVDDLLVHTASWEDHLTTLTALFDKMKAAGLTARPTKCMLGADKVDFVGHQVGEGMIGLHEDNVSKITKATRPTTKKQVRSFLGLTGFYRDYIPNYAAKAVPLTDLTKKKQPNIVQWGEPQEKAFVTLKNHLTSKPILHLPNLKKPFCLRTDASDTGLGAVLLQEHDGTHFPICYASKKLSKSEKNYAAIEKECLAIVWGVKKFHLYLCGTRFQLQTDHQPLSYLDKAKFANARIMRWAMFLQNYDIIVHAIKGSENVGADYLSRM